MTVAIDVPHSSPDNINYLKPVPPHSVKQLLQTAVSHHQAGRLDQAKNLYEQVLANEPENPDAFHLLGLLWFHSGDSERAANFIARAIEQQPGFAPYHDNLAMVCMSAGQHERALQALHTAQEFEGEDAHRSFNIGVACETLARRQDAEAAYRNAVRLAPGESDFHFNLGNLLLADGKIEDAVAAYRSAVRCDPSAEGALTNLANICLQTGRGKEAVECYQTLVRLHADNPDNNLALGRAHILIGQYEAASRQFMGLLDRDPNNLQARRGLVSSLRYIEPTKFQPGLVKHILDLLTPKDIHPQALARAGANQLRHKYGLDGGWSQTSMSALIADIAQDPLFIGLLTSVINTDPILEKFISAVRKAVFGLSPKQVVENPEYLKLAIALAEQAFSNEFICPADDIEFDVVQKLAHRLPPVNLSTDIDAETEAIIVFIAMYQTIFDLECGEALAGLPLTKWSQEVRPLIERVLHGPMEELRLSYQIPRLSDIEDQVSLSVRKQYEENPYPRWRSLHAEPVSSYAAQLKILFPHFEPAGFLEQKVNVLAAGCGTGQEAAAIAASHSDCEVTGLDLSLASLAYALRMADKLGLENLTFYQGDILNVSRFQRRFEVIECTGVLHHMADPGAGWRELADCLMPGGLMKIGLYSELASTEVIAARTQLRSLGITTSASAIAEFRASILEGEPNDLLYPLRFSDDLYTLSACRDLLFHVQETTFTLPEVSRLLENIGLDFIGFEHAAPGTRQRYNEFNPDDRTHTDLAGWDRFEAAHPDTFAAMYVFWCSKKFS